MEIIIGQHTLERALERGTNVDEITLVLRKGTHWVAKNNKLAKFLVFDFKQKSQQ